MTTGIQPVSDGVIFHLDEADTTKHALVITNIINLLSDLGEHTSIELLANGSGLSALLSTSPHADSVIGLLRRGVSVAACANTMRAQSITNDQLVDGVHVVASGVGELVTRQREGWAYIRP